MKHLYMNDIQNLVDKHWYLRSFHEGFERQGSILKVVQMYDTFVKLNIADDMRMMSDIGIVLNPDELPL